jgi:hypothetical protein
MLLSARRERERGVEEDFCRRLSLRRELTRAGELGENCARTEHFVHAEKSKTREIGMEMGWKTSARGQTSQNCQLVCTTRQVLVRNVLRL